MRILVDADSCPVLPEILHLAKERNLPVILVCNFNHEIQPPDFGELIVVDNTPEAADMALMNRSEPGDLVVSGDYGLACMLLGKKANVISPRGTVFSDRNIDRLMARRHFARKERQKGKYQRGPRPFSDEDRKRFLDTILSLLPPIERGNS